MSRLLSIRKGLGLAAAIGVAACAGDNGPTAPALSTGGDAAITAAGPSLTVLRHVGGARVGVAARRVIGPEGGVVAAGGVSLVIPPGALDRAVPIRMVVPPGPDFVVRFAPHGLVFHEPARLVVELDGTSAGARLIEQERLLGIYFEEPIRNGRVTPAETFPVSVDGSTASMPIPHFSGYTMAGG